jgi:hypothetical protein
MEILLFPKLSLFHLGIRFSRRANGYIKPSFQLPFVKNEKHGKANTSESRRVVPAEFFPEIGHRKNREDRKCDDLLDRLELSGADSNEPMRLAGTWKQYSKKAIPQLARITFQRASLRYLRWPYQAKVMKIFEIVRRRIVRTRSSSPVKNWLQIQLACPS